MAIALSQINPTVGDFAANAAGILRDAKRAAAAGASALLTPELCITGYCGEDLFLDDDFIADAERALAGLAKQLPPELAVIVGAPWRENGTLFNAALVLQGGEPRCVHRKMEVPNYEVFDEKRYFAAGAAAPPVIDIGGVAAAVLICEDAWHPRIIAAAKAGGARIALTLNGSPFYLGKHARRLEMARAAQMPIFYCNCVGGQDELVFDGASFVCDAKGAIRAQLPAFAEDFALVPIEQNGEKTTDKNDNLITPYPSDEDAAYGALTLGIADYAAKTGFRGALLGLSGGIDSALVAALAADALGADKVTAVMMPSRHTSRASLEDAAGLAANLGVRLETIAIEPVYEAFAEALAPLIADDSSDAAFENVQARIRGTLLMALSNRQGKLLLATGNKSEFACGYATLYGDMAGGFAPLKDTPKTFVYRLAGFRNRRGGAPIPERILTRAPSAELRPQQTDQDSLPPYDVIDAVIKGRLEEGAAPRDLAGRFAAFDVRRILDMLQAAEYKRRQAPPGVKITSRAFGKDWRMPIASRYRHRLR